MIGIIAPWNYPFTLAIGDALPALVAGNGVVLKPDAQTPLTGLWAAGLLEEAGLPAGLLQVVTGRGAELGTPLIDGADFIMFTGSTATGRKVAAQCGERLMGCAMELGGKNALLVLPDAPLWRAVPGRRPGHHLQRRPAVHQHRAGLRARRRLRRVRAAPRRGGCKALRLGASLTFADDMGSLTSADQLAKVTAHVDDAVSKGAEVLAGGRARPDLGPYFYEPTLLAGVTEDMELCRAETFGPVAAVYRCSSVDEMVERANDSEYGLNASVWTRDVKAGREIAGRIEAGTVNVNEAYAATWASAAPMGGWKQSRPRPPARTPRPPQVHGAADGRGRARCCNIGTPPFLQQRPVRRRHDARPCACSSTSPASSDEEDPGDRRPQQARPRHRRRLRHRPAAGARLRLAGRDGDDLGPGRGRRRRAWPPRRPRTAPPARTRFACDVSDREQVYARADEVRAAAGDVDVLVNNAGVVSGRPLLELPDERIERTFAVNTLALFWTTQGVPAGDDRPRRAATS